MKVISRAKFFKQRKVISYVKSNTILAFPKGPKNSKKRQSSSPSNSSLSKHHRGSKGTVRAQKGSGKQPHKQLEPNYPYQDEPDLNRRKILAYLASIFSAGMLACFVYPESAVYKEITGVSFFVLLIICIL